jgi:aminocarboxymuconate-semialdehyde decarboxylase
MRSEYKAQEKADRVSEATLFRFTDLYTDALRHLARQVGTGQIVMGTQYPFPWEDKAVDHIINTPGLTDDEKIAMLGGTAQNLLNIR